MVRGLMLLAALTAAVPAQAQTDECLPAIVEGRADYPPLTFDLIEDAEGSGIGLRAVGVIDHGAAQRLEEALAIHATVQVVWLDSTGGEAREGLRLGRVLRAHSLSVGVPPGAVCMGACADAFLGGVERIVADDAQVGFSGVVLPEEAETLPPAERERAAARWAEERADYYIRTGVSRGLLRLQLSDGAGALCRLSPAALRRYNVVNSDR